jgi:type IX secretion system PorP/SprF family membrane protein
MKTGLNNKNIFLAIACLFALGTAKAQDPHFSQYFSSPMTVNPALTAKNIGDWRALANFRSQWWGSAEIAPFTTTAASIEKKFATGVTGNNSLGFGLSLVSDASNSGLLKNNYFTFGAAYHLTLDAKNNEHLSLGLQVVYANRLVDASQFDFQSQFGSMGFQRSIPSGDPVNILSNHYADVNAGIYYDKRITDKKWGYHLGASIFHAGTPVEGVYSNSTYRVPRRYSAQGGLTFYRDNGDVIDISMISDNQAQSHVFTAGGVYRIKTNDDTIDALHIGVWNRFGDAIYPYIGVQGTNWLVGLSYDIVNTKVSNAYNSVQSAEFSLAWYFGKKNTKMSFSF